MKTIHSIKTSPSIQIIKQFGKELKRLEEDIRTIQLQMEPINDIPNQYLKIQNIQYTETESIEIQQQSRKSIIDDLQTELLKQTSHTNCTNQLTVMNYFFSIKQETEIDQISLGSSRTAFDFFQDENQDEINQQNTHINLLYSNTQNQLFDEFIQNIHPIDLQQKPSTLKPPSSIMKLKNMMVNELNKSYIPQTVKTMNVLGNSNLNKLKHNIVQELAKPGSLIRKEQQFPAKRFIIYTTHK